MSKTTLLLLCLSIATFDPAHTQQINNSSRQFEHVRTVVKTDYLPSVSVEEQLKYGPPPKWDDPDLSSPDGRIRIIEKGKSLAWQYLYKCGSASVLIRLEFDNRMIHGNRGIQKKLIEGCGWEAISAEYMYIQDPDIAWRSPVYCQVQRIHDVAAQTTITENRCTWPTGYYDNYPNQNPIYREEEVKEVYNCEIEIFPAVFERGEYFMSAETTSAEGPWAKTPVEALTYIILHEYAHFECQIIADTKLWTFAKMDTSEATADAYASSVIRCQGVSRLPYCP
jgi:hypothetical protein